jgi:hypothetical protein
MLFLTLLGIFLSPFILGGLITWFVKMTGKHGMFS